MIIRPGTGSSRPPGDPRVRRLHAPVIAGLAAAGTIAVSGPVTALLFVPESTTTIVARADIVFQGIVVGTWSEVWDAEHDVVVTRNLVEVTTIYKGSIVGDAVVVSVPGGDHPEGGHVDVSGAPQFDVGNRTLISGIIGRDGTLLPVNPYQGIHCSCRLPLSAFPAPQRQATIAFAQSWTGMMTSMNQVSRTMR